MPLDHLPGLSVVAGDKFYRCVHKRAAACPITALLRGYPVEYREHTLKRGQHRPMLQKRLQRCSSFLMLPIQDRGNQAVLPSWLSQVCRNPPSIRTFERSDRDSSLLRTWHRCHWAGHLLGSRAFKFAVLADEVIEPFLIASGTGTTVSRHDNQRRASAIARRVRAAVLRSTSPCELCA